MPLLLLALSLISIPALAEPEVSETRHQDWNRVCVQEDDVRRCEAVQILSVTQNEQTQPILQATVTRSEGQRFIEFALPLGMDLRAGMVIQIDQGDEIRFGYTTCVPKGCAGVLPLDDARYAELRAGSSARLGFLPFGAGQVQILELSLQGFTAASRDI